MALSFLKNWRGANMLNVGRTDDAHALCRWKLPSLGRVKLNTDAALDVENNVMGLGWVLRDDGGRFLAAKGLRVEGTYEVKVAEAICVREALSWLKGTGMGDVDVEMDSQLVYYALCSSSFNSAFGFIVDDVKEVASTIDGVHFYFVKRSANHAATLLLGKPFLCQVAGNGLIALPFILLVALLLI
ncbi:uncharacterized protein LOC116011420 [Ipomoea triloba]|uniref:uncharacterized protein LOC116011420 n=1 Tax=Ipomoea triloba TaxID=35885 RepID=UPI00125D3409|nr:uncharacterized protein LOC116011420 [Ipomoea triloba]XP_031106842.1 uncharacterized protein LOC116011420 [Ipomoea triloba]